MILTIIVTIHFCITIFAWILYFTFIFQDEFLETVGMLLLSLIPFFNIWLCWAIFADLVNICKIAKKWP